MFAMKAGVDMASNWSVRVNTSVGPDNSSNGILDTKPSSKYRITLEQARNRALRAIRREREKNG